MSLRDVVWPTKQKIAVAFLIPLAFFLLFLAISPAYQTMFFSAGVVAQVTGVVAGLIVGMIIYYLMACGLVFIYHLFDERKAKGRKKAGNKELAAAVIFIFIFNPFTISMIYSGGVYLNNYVINHPCGAEIAGFQEISPARDAGLRIGEVITSIDQVPISNSGSISDALREAKAGEYVLVGTELRNYSVMIAMNNETGRPMLGVIVRDVFCSRTSSVGNSALENASSASAIALQACKQSCLHTLESGDNASLDIGPCLLDPIPSEPDWVCDIAHSPRLPVDDLPENQCNFYRTGASDHFIELSLDCRLLRAG